MKSTVKIVKVRKGVHEVPMSDTEAKLRAELLTKSAQLKDAQAKCTELASEVDKCKCTINRLAVDAENQDDTIRKLNTKVTHLVGQIYAYKLMLGVSADKQ